MPRRYIAFDLETAKILPAGVTELLAHRPLGIACAAAVTSGGAEPITWVGAGPVPAPRLSRGEAQAIVRDLAARVAEGYTLLTWNGLAFDFDVLAEESGLKEDCARLALGHVDMMFHAVCALGHFVGLQKAAEGLGLEGKTAGMSGQEAPVRWAEGRHEEVLGYNVQDSRLTLAVAETAERLGRLQWKTARGSIGRMPLPHGWLTVDEARHLPLPDTSWMSSPPSRARFTAWME
jgi:hypothetical protein